MRVLITRPRPEADAFAHALKGRGFTPVVAPMLVTESVPGTPPAAGPVQGLALTSANGARELATRLAVDHPLRTCPVFTVGAATARAAHGAGLGPVTSADGDAGDLAGLIVRQCRPGAGAILYVRAEDTARDLAELLAPHGLSVQPWVVYRTRQANVLPEPARAFLAGDTGGAVVFFSPRTARTFASLALAADLASQCRVHAAVCLSQAVADPLAGLTWRRLVISDRPDRDGILAGLTRLAAHPPAPDGPRQS